MSANLKQIPFYEPTITGEEAHYIQEVINSKKLSGGGVYTEKCQAFFEQKYGFEKCFLTSSCTAALEMCGLVLDLKEGDEVIVPSYTFVTTASAFKLRGANIIFADSESTRPHIDADILATLITQKTKALVIVHYGGVACDMDKIMQLKQQYNFVLIEDNAHGIDAYYGNKPLGSFGELATFSFHDTKPIVAGEGGMLVVNKKEWIQKAEIILEKGTNRIAFLDNEVEKYEWVSLGSSFQLSEITAAFLWAQLLSIDKILEKQRTVWGSFASFFANNLVYFHSPKTNTNLKGNGYIFYAVLDNKKQRDKLIRIAFEKGIKLQFHYSPLHLSRYCESENQQFYCPNAEKYSDCLVRLPCYAGLNTVDSDYIAQSVLEILQKL